MTDTVEEIKPKRKISNTELDNVKNYLAIELAYNMSIILPYREGIALVASLENAEKVTLTNYGALNIKFNPDRFEIKTEIISQAIYREQKMNHLLGVTDE